MNATRAKRDDLLALTSLRGLAALAVVSQHFSATAQANASGWLPSIVPHGYMAVDFFFVLSGFIMSYNYAEDFIVYGWKPYVSFIGRRVSRIFPLGIFVTLTILALGAIASAFDLQSLFINQNAVLNGIWIPVLINIAHIQGFLNEFNLNDPSWSVSVELAAYVIFPVLVNAVFGRSKVICYLYVISGVLFIIHLSTFSANLDLSYREAVFDLGRCISEFGFGMLAFKFYKQRTYSARIVDHACNVISFTCILFFILRVDLALAALFPFLILVYAKSSGHLAKIISSSLFVYLGEISFSLYLLHHMFRRPEFWLVRKIHVDALPPYLAFTLAVIGTLSVVPFAAFTYQYVEKPSRSFLNNIWKRRLQKS